MLFILHFFENLKYNAVHRLNLLDFFLKQKKWLFNEILNVKPTYKTIFTSAKINVLTK